MTNLPYSNSKADPAKAQARIKSALRKLGVARLSFEEDFETQVVRVRFQHEGLPVCVPLDYKALAEAYLKEDPYTWRKNGDEDEWWEKKLEIAYRASFSILDDYLKALVMLTSCGVVDFKQAFLAHFLVAPNKTVGDMLVPELDKIVTGRLMLTAGK